jgi:hypothetical protein
MSFAAQNAEAIVAAYGGVYPVHPDADLDHRSCLAAALRKVADLVFIDLQATEEMEPWRQGYWTGHLNYRNEILSLAENLTVKPNGF